MTYGELSYKAKKLYTKGKITICEYLEMTTPLDREIEQEPKTGRWKRIGYDLYECSICGQDVMTGYICAYRHCHCCGARMVSPQESEEKDAT